MQKDDENELLTPEEATELLKVSKRTMYEWLRTNVIPSERIGERLIRVRRKDILTPDAKVYFEQGCQLAQNPETMVGFAGRYPNAESCFRKAIEINPRYALAYSAWGFYLGYWGHYQLAIEPLEKAVELNPNFANYLNLGNAFVETRRYEKAVLCLRTALEIRTDNIEPSQLAEIHFQIGFSMLMLSYGLFGEERNQKLNEVVGQFRKSLEIEVNWRAAHFLSQVFLFQLYDYEQALALAEEIQEVFPHESDHTREMVRIYDSSRANAAIITSAPPKKHEQGDLLNTHEVGEILGLERRTVNDYILQGKLKSVKGKQSRNFVSRADLEEFRNQYGL